MFGLLIMARNCIRNYNICAFHCSKYSILDTELNDDNSINCTSENKMDYSIWCNNYQNIATRDKVGDSIS